MAKDMYESILSSEGSTIKVTINQSSLFRSRDWLSANQEPVLYGSIVTILSSEGSTVKVTRS